MADPSLVLKCRRQLVLGVHLDRWQPVAADAPSSLTASASPAPLCFAPAQFSHYFWPSVVGIMPSLIIYVWLGSLAADVTEAVAGGGMSTPPAGEGGSTPWGPWV